MREEAGISSLDGDESAVLDTQAGEANGGAIAGLIGRSASIGLGVSSPTSMSGQRDENDNPMERAMSPSADEHRRRPSMNPKLAPGTAVGMSAGPTTDSEPVDWDLWQSVVYEGPAAVARTSSEELNRAIASGIPQAIRGVVWQVLAQSKNEELEAIYRDLVNRATDKDGALTAGSINMLRSNSNGQVNGNGREKESIKSSASSVHSDYSTPATTATNGTGLASPTMDKVDDPLNQLRTSLIGHRSRRSLDASGVAKLEKVIKRDLGARTSYSKYVMSAGLQDGLFGICKAYALFDEGVGYAQGMNFIAMPLLFNVSQEPPNISNTY